MTEPQDWWRHDPEGERQGFGIVYHLVSGEWVVERTLLGSPAEAAGINKADVLHSVGPQPAKGLRYTVLHAHMELLDRNSDHKLNFLRAQNIMEFAMRPKTLRELFEEEASRNGGAALASCYSCPSCYSRYSGVKTCSDCPGYNCTTG